MLALYIVASTLLLVVGLLSIPVEVTFDVRTVGDRRPSLRVGWLFGVVGKTVPRKRKRPVKKPGGKKRRKGGRSDLKFFLTVLRTGGLVPEAVRLARRMLGSIHIRCLDARLRVGLDDPADTGLLYAVVWPTMMPRASSGRIRFTVEPDFQEATFEASLQGDVRVFPVELVANGLRFALSAAGLRVIKSIVAQLWRRKK